MFEMIMLDTYCYRLLGKMRCRKKRTLNDYVFYRIVESSRDGEFLFQCINTKATFLMEISGVNFDLDIIYALHPVQACFFAIEYAQYMRKMRLPMSMNQCKKDKKKNYSHCRYGIYRICYQDRDGNISFMHLKTGEMSLMDPCEIALSKDIIRAFDAVQAFQIGLLAGLRHNRKSRKPNKLIDDKKGLHLKVVR